MSRTTITLTPEADSLVRKVMKERGISFKDAINVAIVDGLSGGGARAEYETPVFDLGRAQVGFDHALAIVGQMEDEELLRKRELGK